MGKEKLWNEYKKIRAVLHKKKDDTALSSFVRECFVTVIAIADEKGKITIAEIMDIMEKVNAGIETK